MLVVLRRQGQEHLMAWRAAAQRGRAARARRQARSAPQKGPELRLGDLGGRAQRLWQCAAVVAWGLVAVQAYQSVGSFG